MRARRRRVLAVSGYPSVHTEWPSRFFPDLPIEYDSRTSAIDAALSVNAAIVNRGVYYVRPSTGSDGDDGSIEAPFATVARAMRTATGAASRVVMLEDCVIDPWDLRSTDASQSVQQFKWLDGNGFRVVVRVAGPALSDQTWTNDSTHTNCWRTVLSLGASQQVTRVLNHAVPDDWGYDTPLRLFTSAAALNASASPGYFFDNATKTLWLNTQSNVQDQRADYRALYLNSAGTSRLFVSGASLGVSGITLDGVQILTLDAAGRRPEVWLDRVTQTYAHNKGADFRGWYVATDSVVYGSENDGANGFQAWAGGKSLLVTARSVFARSGDRRTFNVNGTLQGVSAHGGCNHVSFDSQYIENNGQGVADTCATGSHDFSWIKRAVVQGGAPSVTASNILAGSAATDASRFMFLDECVSIGAAAFDAEASANGEIQLHTRVPFSQGAIGGRFAPYGAVPQIAGVTL